VVPHLATIGYNAEPKGEFAVLPAVLSLLMLAALALAAGAFYLWRREGYRRQAVLMLVLAAIALINVAIWTLPSPGGQSPAGQLAQ
jgi:hypothetical protein